jgi:hypothetical protein
MFFQNRQQLFIQIQILLLIHVFLLSPVYASAASVGPPPTSVIADVETDSKGNIVFTHFYKQIANDPYFARKHYVISSIRVREDLCIRGICDTLMWEAVNATAFNDNPPVDGYVLPDSIVYGQSLPLMNVKINPAELEMDIPYFAVIGVAGFNSGGENKVFFSVNAHFLVTKDATGASIVRQSGKEGILRRVIVP